MEDADGWYNYNPLENLLPIYSDDFNTSNLRVRNIIPINEQWLDKYHIFKEFYLKYERVPRTREIYENVKIGSWLSNQKFFFNKCILAEDKIKYLDEVTTQWRYVSIEIPLGWMVKYDFFKEFYETKKRLPRITEKYKNTNLGYWLKRQSDQHGKQNLSKWKIEMLDKVTKDWMCNKIDLNWYRSYNALVDFCNEHNRLPRSIGEERKLNFWLRSQFLKHKNNIHDEKYKCLCEIMSYRK